MSIGALLRAKLFQLRDAENAVGEIVQKIWQIILRKFCCCQKIQKCFVVTNAQKQILNFVKKLKELRILKLISSGKFMRRK